MSTVRIALSRDDELEAFSHGDCWILAQVISELSGGLPLVGVGIAAQPVGNWMHVGVRLADGRILDITGARSEEDFLAHWQEELENTIEFDDFGDDEDAVFEVEAYLFDLDPVALEDQEQVFDIPEDQVRAVATRLLAEAGV